MGKSRTKRPAVFIDRDGTIIQERFYLRKIKDVRILRGTEEALQLLRGAGYLLILVTNQSGIGRGYFTETKLKQIHAHIQKKLTKKGLGFDAIYYCPHVPDDKCTCRKPKTGMVLQAAKRFSIDLSRSFTIGDHVNDFLLGQNMGGKGIFILTGHGRHEYKKIQASSGKMKPDIVAKNILAAARCIVAAQDRQEEK